MLKKLIAALVGGVILFVWGFVSWTMLPWRDADVHTFTDEAAVIEAMRVNSSKSGIYFIPSNQDSYSVDEPTAFINVQHEGFQVGMGQMMVMGFLNNVLIALVMVLLLGMTKGLSYMQRVGFVALAGVGIGLGASLPSWNWFGFPTGYILVQMSDYFVMWLLAGFALAKLVPERR